MRPLPRLRVLAGIFAVLLLGVLPPSQALASCAMIPAVGDAVAKAEIVFVGTVTATAQRDLWATVSVEEVWNGPDLPAVVQVQGGQGGNVATSVDREFKQGFKYLFVPTSLQNDVLIDNACSSTMVWEDALGALRPSSARPPIGGTPLEPAGFDLSGLIGPIGVALAVSAALLAVGLLARSRQPG
jgi:hypothetical protein